MFTLKFSYETVKNRWMCFTISFKHRKIQIFVYIFSLYIFDVPRDEHVYENVQVNFSKESLLEQFEPALVENGKE